MTRPWRFSIRRLMAAIAGLACLLGALVWAERSGVTLRLIESFEAGVAFGPSFAWAAGFGLVVAVIAAVRDRSVWRVRSLWLLIPTVLPIVILAFGIVFEYEKGVASTVIERRRVIVEWLPWLQVPVGLVLLGCFRSVSRWLIVIGISLASAWLSFGTMIMSWMSVTNIWL